MNALSFRWRPLLAAFLFIAAAAVRAADAPPALKPTPAAASPIATQATMLGATWAGPRVVAVGDHGVVLLSDDQGAHYRQARAVPLSSSLTSVSFADARNGWAVGHWGAILHTTDGGETWAVQRLVPEEDRPLFSVHFFDAQNGLAVGLWSLVLRTTDGGVTWTPQTLSPPPGAAKADLNLLSLFADGAGHVYAAAERGMVLRSDDQGQHWQYLATGYKGSFWTGTALPDGSLLVGGQRGTLYRGSAGGTHWEPVPSGSKSSVTAMAQLQGRVHVVGLDGLQLDSHDGVQFSGQPREDRLSLTAVLATPNGRWLTFSRRGVVGP